MQNKYIASKPTKKIKWGHKKIIHIGQKRKEEGNKEQMDK